MNNRFINTILAPTLLLISLGANGALLMKLKESIELNSRLDNINMNLIKENYKFQTTLEKDKYDLNITLANCNATLASVQAKPAVAAVCPAIPLAPVCLDAPACPAVTIACPKMEPSPAVIAPAPIATPIPARIIYRYIHHRIHYRKRVTKPEPICDWNFKNEN